MAYMKRESLAKSYGYSISILNNNKNYPFKGRQVYVRTVTLSGRIFFSPWNQILTPPRTLYIAQHGK